MSKLVLGLVVYNENPVTSSEISVDKKTVQTNMVYFTVLSDEVGATSLATKLGEKSELQDGSIEEAVGVIPISERTIRAVFHHQITSGQVRKAAEKIVRIFTS